MTFNICILQEIDNECADILIKILSIVDLSVYPFFFLISTLSYLCCGLYNQRVSILVLTLYTFIKVWHPAKLPFLCRFLFFFTFYACYLTFSTHFSKRTVVSVSFVNQTNFNRGLTDGGIFMCVRLYFFM